MLLTPLITIVLYITSLNKFDDWLKNKKRERAFEAIENLLIQIRIANYQRLKIWHFMSKCEALKTKSNYLITKERIEEFQIKMEKKLVKFDLIIEQTINAYDVMKLWEVTINKVEIIKIIGTLDKLRRIMAVISDSQKTIEDRNNTYEEMLNEHLIKYNKLIDELNDVDEIISNKNFDSIFTIN